MGALVMESFANVDAWTARNAGGAPSTGVSITVGGPTRVPGLSTPGAVIHAEAETAGHFVERAGAAVDLRPFRDVLLWVRSDRVADGTTQRPLFAEVRLGSAASPVGGPGNGWRRLVPIEQADVWQPVPLALDDLPDPVRQAVTTVRLTNLDATVGWRMEVDAILAVRPEVLVDADAALLSRLHNKVTVDGAAVPAVIVPVSGTAPQPPVLRISNYDVRPDRTTSPATSTRTDYSETGFALRPPATVYQLDYAVEALATDRASAAKLLQFVLAELTPTATLLGAGRLMTAEWIDQPATAAPPVVAPPADHPVVHLRVRAAQPGAGPAQRAVRPFSEIRLEVDQRA
jgi:hypothetical protein